MADVTLHSESQKTQCLIIGSGIAGLSSAIALAEKGYRCTVVTAASSVVDTNTDLAQGGIVYQAPSADTEVFAEDIRNAGGRQNYPPAVQQLVTLGPDLVRSVLIDRAGVCFDRDQKDQLCLTKEAAHTESRILYSGDQSGHSIEEGLYHLCQKYDSIQFVTQTTAVDLLMTSFHGLEASVRHEPARCFGVFVFDQIRQQVYPIYAEHTVLATGGLGQLYQHSTNSHFARGDGIAMAHRAGARLSQMEFLQFHPTTFYHPKARRFLITEAVRGEGGVLVDGSGRRFLSRWLKDYEVPELAPRDRVAWAINQELLNTGAECVYLDISHKGREYLEGRFPYVFQTCLSHGVDISKVPIPVVPGAHYQIGGVWADLKGATSIPRLWAVGETACTGLHGVNRLASTSLLEGLVWGTRAGEAISEELEEKPETSHPEILPWKSESASVDPGFLTQDWLTLKQTMWNYVGLIKTESRLERADGILTELERGISIFYRRAQLSDALIGLRHATHVARLILKACRRNQKSVGCYLREEREI